MVAKLNCRKDGKVSEAARLLINKWKAEVNKSKKAAAAGSSSSRGATRAVVPPCGEGEPGVGEWGSEW